MKTSSLRKRLAERRHVERRRVGEETQKDHHSHTAGNVVVEEELSRVSNPLEEEVW